MKGTSETCRKKQLSRPMSWRTWRAASRKGSDSMSPTVPPISVITTSTSADAHGPDPVLDLVGDVRDHLDGVAEVVAAPLLGDHAGVDLAGGHVGDLAEVGVQEPLVVPDVQVGLGAVVGDEDLAVLERVHRPGVDVEVGVELLHRDPESARLQQAAQAGGREALPERGGDASGDEHVLRGSGNLHGVLAYPSGTAPSAPAAPNAPPDVVRDRIRASTAVVWPAVAVGPVHGGDAGHRRTRRGAGRAIPVAPHRRRPRRWRCRPARRAVPRGSGRLRIRVGAQHDEDQRRALVGDPAGRQQARPGQALHDGGRVGAERGPGGLRGRDRPAEQRADPVVGGRVRRHLGVLGLLGQLAAEGVDQRRLARVEQQVRDVVPCR